MPQLFTNKIVVIVRKKMKWLIWETNIPYIWINIYLYINKSKSPIVYIHLKNRQRKRLASIIIILMFCKGCVGFKCVENEYRWRRGRMQGMYWGKISSNVKNVQQGDVSYSVHQLWRDKEKSCSHVPYFQTKTVQREASELGSYPVDAIQGWYLSPSHYK